MNCFPGRSFAGRALATICLLLTGLMLIPQIHPILAEDYVYTDPFPKPIWKRNPAYVVLGYNDLGMHCMNQDFSNLCILPPYNNLHAEVIDRRGEHPRIVEEGATVLYSIPGNTTSANKTNFWTYAPALFGVQLPLDIGLTGNGLSGTMSRTNGEWVATGIPVTPITDANQLNPYPLAKIDVRIGGTRVASTRTVIPVSWEISCNLCHKGGQSGNIDLEILRTHDIKHGTNLQASTPVLCASCHADPALGTVGQPNTKPLSHAIHGSHAPYMGSVAALGNTCYACHPGFVTNCQRDVHFARGIYCVDCHGNMASLANPTRQPWIDEPTCQSCHQAQRPNFQFEEPGKLFKDSRGHNGVHCASCHGSPHAITPAVTAADNYQANLHQGYPGVINRCVVCHQEPPHDPFNHSLED